ncbi:hypothetical protein N7465_012005 [Penicillium sp. CMV-2018d]|nr:hypothetical protein N7465_012005 [Penicillium sp. CMV-2018d]
MPYMIDRRVLVILVGYILPKGFRKCCGGRYQLLTGPNQDHTSKYKPRITYIRYISRHNDDDLGCLRERMASSYNSVPERQRELDPDLYPQRRRYLFIPRRAIPSRTVIECLLGHYLSPRIVVINPSGYREVCKGLYKLPSVIRVLQRPRTRGSLIYSWPVVRVVPDATKETLREFLYRNIHVYYSAFNELISDNGINLLSGAVWYFVGLLKARYRTIILYHPQTNSKVENFNRLEYAIIKRSPYFLVYGIHPRITTNSDKLLGV